MTPTPVEPVQLFDSFPEPVLFLLEEKICYRNPAAAQLFPQWNLGDGIPDQLVALLPPDGADATVVTQLRGYAFCLSAQNTPWGLLLLFRPAAAAVPAPSLGRISLQLRQQTSALAAALQRLAPDGEELNRTKHTRYLSIANQGLYRILRLVDHLDFAQQEDRQVHHPAPMDLAGLCQELAREVSFVAEQAGWQFCYESELTSLLTVGDAALLWRLLLGLLSNAMKAAAQGGCFGLKLTRTGTHAILTVWDDGAGVSGDQLSTLFGQPTIDPRPGDGLGLGLKEARRISDLHGGAIMIESRAGDGLRAVVSLPLRPIESTSLRSPVWRYDPSGGFSPILVEFSNLLPPGLYGPEDVE